MAARSQMLRDFMPIGVLNGLIFLSFGLLSLAEGLSLPQTLVASVLIYSSPLQILLVQNLQDGAALVPVILALNARFALMTASLMPYIAPGGRMRPAAWAHLIVPSILSVCLSTFRRGHDDPVRYFRVMGAWLFAVAVIATGIGYIATPHVPEDTVKPLITFALAILFVALNARLWPKRADVSSFWIGLGAMPMFLWLLDGMATLVGPFLIGALVVLHEQRVSLRA